MSSIYKDAERASKTGYETLVGCREQSPGKPIPVIIASASYICWSVPLFV
ncbi:MAG: hypothetical protein AB1489_24000 [Acidobacteriota bacterium]